MLKNKPIITQVCAWKVDLMFQMLQSLKNLHRRGIIHLDIKPDNFFMIDNNNLVLGDFGFSNYYRNVD